MLLDFILPRESLTGRSGEWITPQERTQLRTNPVIESKAELQTRGIRFLDSIRAASSYKGAYLLQRALYTYKYGRVRDLSDDLANLICDVALHYDDAVLCPVPLHWTRTLVRGFNQAQLLTDRIGQSLAMPVTSLLSRTRPTGHQAWRQRTRRGASVRNAFAYCGKHVPRHVVLIDDVTTSGATLDACAHALKDAGVQRVDAWVVAHGGARR